MFDEGSTTFTYQLLIRAFTFSDLYSYTEETISFDNETFVGDDLIIKYNN